MADRPVNALIVDLDGTLLHPEPDAIPVPGHSGVQYMSRDAATLLAGLSRKIPVAIATGRNARSVSRLVVQLNEVDFRGFVLENGLAARPTLDPPMESRIEPDDVWADVARSLPEWERLQGYETCLAMIAPPALENPADYLKTRLEATHPDVHFYREARKIFVFPRRPSKLSGVRALNLAPYIVLGDETNDLDLVAAARHAGVPASAHDTVKQCAAKNGHYCSPNHSHGAAVDLLEWAEEQIRRLPASKNPVKRKRDDRL